MVSVKREYRPSSLEWLERRDLLAAHLLHDINPSPEIIAPANLHAVGDSLFFSAQKGLWKTDSVSEETSFLADVDIPNWSQFSSLGDKLLFAGGDFAHGVEVWVSDGSTDGTRRLVDIAAGPANGLSGSNSDMFVPVGDEVFFVARSGDPSLWKTDGTQAGTTLVKEFSAPFASTMLALNDVFYFVVGDSLMKSDGTSAGTVELATHDRPQIHAATSEHVYFSTGGGTEEGALWRTDGTAEGTIQLRENVKSVDGLAFEDSFVYEPNESTELWQSDGTAEGTRLMRDLGDVPAVLMASANGHVLIGKKRPASPPINLPAFGVAPIATELVSYNPTTDEEQILATDLTWYSRLEVTSLGELAYFRNGGAIWQTDGTTEGTFALPEGVDPRRVSINGKQFFVDEAGLNVSSGQPDAGRTLPINTGQTMDSMRNPLFVRAPEFQEVGDTILFTGNQGLWETDGTERGTSQVMAWDSPVTLAASPFHDQALLLVSESLGSFDFPMGKSELWASDGTADGTVRIAGSDQPLIAIAQLDDYVYFRDAADLLWQLDTQLNFKRIPWYEGPGRYQIHRLGEQTIFATSVPDCDEAGCDFFIEIRKAAGDAEQAELISRIGPSRRQGLLEPMVPIGDALAFIAETDKLGAEIWLTDGTEAGTRVAFETIEGTTAGGHKSTNPKHLQSFSGGLLFETDMPGEDSQIFYTDGTEEGTREVASGWERRYGEIWLVGDGFAFSAKDPERGRELWLSDGNGTPRVVDIAPNGESSYPAILGSTNDGKLYFQADDSTHGYELWVTDGSVEGTRMVKDINNQGSSIPQAGESSVDISFLLGTATPSSRLTQMGDEFFFVATTPDSGRELWKSDGTEEGTQQVLDLQRGPRSSEPHSFHVIRDMLFFAADDDFGFEPRVYVPGENPLRGDADGDGTVGFSDFLILSSNFGKNDQSFADGDFDADGQVTFADFLVLSANFGTKRFSVPDFD